MEGSDGCVWNQQVVHQFHRFLVYSERQGSIQRQRSYGILLHYWPSTDLEHLAAQEKRNFETKPATISHLKIMF